MIMTGIILSSVLLQFATVIRSLRLIGITGGRISWVLVSVATLLMAVRRCLTLYDVLIGRPLSSTDVIFEGVGLLASLCMFAGIVLITPLLRSIKQSEDEQRKLVGELQQALSRIKKLSGMLPICSSCKKIRDDKGYWNQVEVYIRDHSEAEFTHGVCPECAQRLFPGYYEKMMAEESSEP